MKTLKAIRQLVRDTLHQFVLRLSCFIFGHKHSMSSQGEEEVKIHKLDGTTISARVLVERIYCGRCRNQIENHIVGNGPPQNPSRQPPAPGRG